MRIILLAISLLASLSLQAQEVPKEQWITAMKTALPAYFCHEEQYFRQCFEVSATECEDVAASTTRICLNEINSQIPAILVQPNDGSTWGTKVGTCAGSAYESTLIKKRISNEKCNNASNWQ